MILEQKVLQNRQSIKRTKSQKKIPQTKTQNWKNFKRETKGVWRGNNGLKAFIFHFDGLKKFAYVNTVSTTVQNLGFEFVGYTLRNTFPGRKVTVEITGDKCFRIPKSKYRRILKGVAIKNRFKKFRRDLKIISVISWAISRGEFIKLDPAY